MTRIAIHFAVLVLTLMPGRTDPASGRATQHRPGVVPRPAAQTTPKRKQFAPPDYSLKVFYDHRLPQARKDSLEPVKDLLNKAKLGAPEERIAYFQSIIGPNETQVGGWAGLIHSVKPIQGGQLVELRVTAKQSGGVDTANIMERYSIRNGRIKYLGSYIPNDIPRVQVGF